MPRPCCEVIRAAGLGRRAGRGRVVPRGSTMNDVTRILSAIEQGDPQAAEQLLPLVYDELRRLAAQRLAQEKPGQTLQATALVHDAYLRLVGPDGARGWDGRGHFFAAAAEAMRRILVDNARRKARAQARRRTQPGRTRRGRARRRGPRRRPVWPWTRPSRGWRPRTAARPSSSSSATSPACPSTRPPRPSASRAATANHDWAYARAWLRLAMPAANRRPPGLPQEKIPGPLEQRRADSRIGL